MLVILAVLVLLIVRLQDPDVARALGRVFAPQGEAGKAALKVAPPTAAVNAGRTDFQTVPRLEGGLQIRPTVEAPQPKPPPELPLGPTDEDEEEAAAAQGEFQAVYDGTLGIQIRDMFAYRRLVQWVENQSASLMEKRARTDLTLNDFKLSPDQCRGALVKLHLTARMIVEDNRQAPREFGFPVYEIWGSAADSGSRLYDVIVVDLPEGLTPGRGLHVKVTVVGYFLKWQGYEPAKAKPGARPDGGPVLIGRVVWAEPPAQGETPGTDWPWAWVVLGIFLVLFAVRLGLLIFKRRPRSRMTVTSTRHPGAILMEEWLDHAAAGEAPDDDLPDERQDRTS